MKTENAETYLLYMALAIAVIALIFSFYTIISPLKTKIPSSEMPKAKSRMSFSSFDAQLAEELMDKNRDGLCDFCGMRIEDCVEAGMMQCSMDQIETVTDYAKDH